MTSHIAILSLTLDRELREANGATERLGILTTAFFRADATQDDWERAEKFRMPIELTNHCQFNLETDASDNVARDYAEIHESCFYGFQRATARVSTALRNRTA